MTSTDLKSLGTKKENLVRKVRSSTTKENLVILNLNFNKIHKKV
jgi:hypothetical protein